MLCELHCEWSKNLFLILNVVQTIIDVKIMKTQK